MSDIVLEIIRATIVAFIFTYLLLAGRKEGIRQHKGWFYILAGFSLVLFGMVIDITDNFPSLNKFVVIGDTKYEAFLEKVVGYLFGFVLLAIGFWKWLPTVIALKEAEKRLESSSNDLKVLNEQLRHDLTERKGMEEALVHAVQQWRTTFDSITDMVSLLDAEGKILRCNKTMKNFIGKPFHEILNRSCWEVMLGSTTPIENCPFLRMKETLRRETLVISVNDRWFNIVIDPILNETGIVIGAVNIISDITERKRAEKEMASLQEQLRQSQKMEAIGHLAGGVAHDFNNLLTVITGYTDLLLRSLAPDSPLYPDTLEIKKASEKAESLTRQLLAFSRKQVIQPKVLNLNTLVSNMDKMLRRLIGEHIESVTCLAENLGKTKVDPGQIEQVIINLAVNARDAMPGGGRLTIKTTNMELDEEYARTRIDVAPGPYVMLSISDTGCGMSPEIKEHIFEPFFTTKGEGRGTGLGLSTVYGIIKQLGGSVWVDSEPGQGTTFKIYLPRNEEGFDVIAPEGNLLRWGPEVC